MTFFTSVKANRLLLSSGAGVVLIKLINSVLGIVTVVLFARLLSPDQLGIYLYVLTVARFLAFPLQLGIPTLLTREIAIAVKSNQPFLVNGIVKWSYEVILVGSVILGLLLVGGYYLVIEFSWFDFQKFDWAHVFLVVALMPAIAFLKRVMGILGGFKKPFQSRIPDGLIRPILLLVFGGIGLSMELVDEVGLLMVYFVCISCGILTGNILALRAQRQIDGSHAEFNHPAWLKSLWPLSVFAAAAMFKSYTDILMLGIYDSLESVAYYKVAVQISAVPLFLQVAVNVVISPRIASLNSSGELHQLQKIAVWGSRIAFSGALLFSFILALYGKAAIGALLGVNYDSVYLIAIILAFGTCVNAFFGGTTLILNMTRRESKSATNAVSTAVANVLLNLLLIPFWGGVGAAIATVTTTIAMQYLAWNRVRADIGVRSDAFARIESV